MKRIVYFLSFLFLSSLYFMDLAFSECSPFTPCCCHEYPGGEEKCFTQGFCCASGDEEFWDPVSCFKFEFWVAPKSSMFTVGKPTQITLYIHNTGAYPDDYNITSNITASPSSDLILIDPPGVINVSGVSEGETRRVYPMVTVLEAHVTGEIFFNATSLSDLNVTRNATLTIIESDLPVSLPEFSSIALIGMIVLVGIVYFIFCTKINKC